MRKSFEIVWFYSKKSNWCTNEKKKLNQIKGAKTCKGRQKLIFVVVVKKKNMSMKEVTNNMISSRIKGLKKNTCDWSWLMYWAIANLTLKNLKLGCYYFVKHRIPFKYLMIPS